MNHPHSPHDEHETSQASHVREFQLLDRNEVPLHIRGRMLGFGSSQSDYHTHPLNTPPPTGAGGPSVRDATVATSTSTSTRCPACRWFEARIFAVDAELSPDDVCTCDVPPDAVDHEHAPHCGEEPARARYLVLTYGRTVVDGEHQRRRAVWTNSTFEVIEVLTQRAQGGEKFIPAPAARALAQAAALDDVLRDAYVNRAVV